MYPNVFDYFRPESLAEAVALLAEHGEDARPLAGGQSLRQCEPQWQALLLPRRHNEAPAAGNGRSSSLRPPGPTAWRDRVP